MLSVETLVGIISLIVGGILLVTRINPLRFGEYRFDYVMLHVALASACMYTGVTLFSGVAYVSFVHFALLCASICHMSYTGGIQWAPPAYMLNTQYAESDE